MRKVLLAVGLLPLACRPAAARYMVECSFSVLRDTPVWTYDYPSRAPVRADGFMRKNRFVTAFATQQVGSKLWVHLVGGAVLDGADLSLNPFCGGTLPPFGKERWDWDYDKIGSP